MWSKIKKGRLALDFIQNMGWRYIAFRIKYLIEIKSGRLKAKFPTQPTFKTFISLTEWRNKTPQFFFQGKNIKGLTPEPTQILKDNFEKIKSGKVQFFSHTWLDLGVDFNWITNPETNFKYDIAKHWSEIESLSKDSGDIKYVWEKARFSYVYHVIRYDFHYQDDQAEFVLSEIEDFITKNPLNQGPNYVCSQEISLRVLNWTFALYYYKDSEALTEERFKTILNSIYWQLHHVYNNINFSRIAVRNNHAITETLMLYLSNLMFPFMEDTKLWSKKGKSWFEEEVDYQIYDDGTFLQFSMNYHRVVVQLLTWGIRLSELHNNTFKPVVYEKAQKSLNFLEACMDPVSGQLPNYGSNDGALFFPLTNDDYRVYKSQLDDLRAVLQHTTAYNTLSRFWYGVTDIKPVASQWNELESFKESGYYIIQEDTTKTFIRCGSYKDRPFQSDNLHIDIWHNGINYLWDSGSYKYNTDTQTINYYVGIQSHNTVSISEENQMLKQGRFIWNFWVNRAEATVSKDQNSKQFKGSINAFRQLGGIKHTRTVEKLNDKLIWNVVDSFDDNAKGRQKQAFWQINPEVYDKVEVSAKDANNNKLNAIVDDVFVSNYYGQKIASKRITFTTSTQEITTVINLRN